MTLALLFSILIKRTITPKERLIAAQDEAAAAAMRLISDLGEIGIDSGAKLAAARDAYDALSETSRAKVTNLSVLEAAEARYRALIDASGEAARRANWKAQCRAAKSVLPRRAMD